MLLMVTINSTVVKLRYDNTCFTLRPGMNNVGRARWNRNQHHELSDNMILHKHEFVTFKAYSC